MPNEIFKNVNVKVAPKSGFNKSFKNIGTLPVGTLVPILCDEVIPGSSGTVKVNIMAQLKPLATDTYMRTSLRVESFLVPMRILYGGYENWLTQQPVSTGNYPASPTEPVYLPKLLVNQGATYTPAQIDAMETLVGKGTLADYLGFHFDKDLLPATPATWSKSLNIFPFLAYHKIYDDWYRNSIVQTPLMRKNTGNNYATIANLNSYVCTLRPETFDIFDSINSSNKNMYNDGVDVFSLRQRNYGTDYFTSATPSPEMSKVVSLDVVPPQTDQSVETTAQTTFTISALRAANSIQQFLERNNIAGVRLQDYVRGVYGANLNSGVAQRAIYLGSAKYDVYSNGIYQSAQETTPTANPFQSIGTKYGNAYASGTDFVCKFEANEPCILMVIASLVPEVNYASGIRRYLSHYTKSECLGDLANPMLQNVGPQEIRVDELAFYVNGALGSQPFGYTDRYAEFKTMLNEVHGELRPNGSLNSFVAYRAFSGSSAPSISTNFLQIPKTALDNVFAVNTDATLGQFGAWYDSFIEYKVVQPLYKYSLPTLQDPAYEHGRDIQLQKGGERID